MKGCHSDRKPSTVPLIEDDPSYAKLIRLCIQRQADKARRKDSGRHVPRGVSADHLFWNCPHLPIQYASTAESPSKYQEP